MPRGQLPLQYAHFLMINKTGSRRISLGFSLIWPDEHRQICAPRRYSQQYQMMARRLRRQIKSLGRNSLSALTSISQLHAEVVDVPNFSFLTFPNPLKEPAFCEDMLPVLT